MGDVARTEAKHGGESVKPTPPGAVDGHGGISVAHRPQEHRLLANHAIAPVAGQRDHRRVRDQVVEYQIVVERQPVRRRAGRRGQRQRYPHIGVLLDDRAHPRTVTVQGRPSGADGRTCART